MGYTHLLLIKPTEQHRDNFFNFYTSRELELQRAGFAHKPTNNDQGNKSTVVISLLPLKDPSAAFTINATTTMSGVIIRHKDQSETYVNPTDVQMARSKAIKKGVKASVQKCSH